MLTKTNEDGLELYIDEMKSEAGSLADFYFVFETNAGESLWGYYCSNCNTFNEKSGPIWKFVCRNCANSHTPE